MQARVKSKLLANKDLNYLIAIIARSDLARISIGKIINSIRKIVNLYEIASSQTCSMLLLRDLARKLIN